MTGWLLTWLWQSLTLTLAVSLLLKARRINAATRHFVWWAAFAAVIWLGWTSSPYGGLTPVPVPGSDPNGTGFAPLPLVYVEAVSPFLVSIFLGVWSAIALVKLVRLVPGVHAVYALRDRCRPFPAPLESQLPLWLEARERGRRAELAICDAVPGATVIGFQRPVIALPASLIAAMSTEDLDQIILHEHAHVQRRDDWSRLAQTLLQAALWIHPAVAAIGRALNREREMACDEWVVARTGLPKAYARCLTRAAEVRSRIRVEPALVPALFGGQQDLVLRVNRLLAVRGRTRRGVSSLAAVAAAAAIVVASVKLNAVPLIGEYVHMALPDVMSPAGRLVFDSIRVAPVFDTIDFVRPIQPGAIASQPGVGDRGAAASAALGEPNEPFEPNEPNEPNELRELREPTEPIELSAFLSGRAFEGAYPRYDALPAAADAPNPWREAATPGVEIANAARKTGVGIAGAVSRASVSLARRFQ